MHCTALFKSPSSQAQNIPQCTCIKASPLTTMTTPTSSPRSDRATEVARSGVTLDDLKMEIEMDISCINIIKYIYVYDVYND